MKTKLYLFILFMITFTASVNSQIFKGGLILGVNGCQVDGDNLSGYNKFGLLGGAFIYTPLSKVMDIQLEIEYNGKGAQSVSTADEGYQTEYTLNLNYVELPVLLRYNTIYNVGIDAGLGFGYLFNPTQSISNFTSNQTSFNHFELSGIIGLEYKLNEKFSTIARFSYSLNPIAKTYTNTNDLFLASGLYNNMITVGICYFFPGT